MAYFVNADVATFLSITLSAAETAALDQIRPALDAFVDSYSNRTWTKLSTDDITEIFDGGIDVFFVKNSPIASITSIKTGKTPSYAGDLLTTEDYYIYDSFIRLAAKASDLPRSVEIIYRTSATVIPVELKQALIQWAAQILKSRDLGGKTVSRISTGPVSMDFLAKDGIPKFVLDVLERYRLRSGI